MALVKYNPLNSFVPTTFGDLIESVLNDSARSNVSYRPAVDIIKNDSQIELHLSAPGLSKEDFKIDLDENRLTISGERKFDEEKKANYKKIESSFGAFSRSFRLSDDINKEGISASYEAGILTLTLPLVEKKVNKTEIKVK